MENQEMLQQNADEKLSVDKRADAGQNVLTKIVSDKIREAFMTVGIYITLAVLLIVLFAIIVLPLICDRYFYNAGEIVGSSGGTYPDLTTRFELDLMTYAEAFLPMRNIHCVKTDSVGYGKFIIGYRDNEGSHAGIIDKNRLILFEPDSLERKIDTVYVCNNDLITELVLTSPEGKLYDLESVKDLKDDKEYCASITLNRCMRYDDFLKWCRRNEINPEWCAYATDLNYEDPEEIWIPEYFQHLDIGERYSEDCFGFSLEEGYDCYCDSTKYPLLTSHDAMNYSGDGLYDYDTAVRHVESMLTYLEKNTELTDMLGYNSFCFLEYAKEEIDTNGLYIYGFVISDYTGRELKQLNELEEVNIVMADPK